MSMCNPDMRHDAHWWPRWRHMMTHGRNISSIGRLQNLYLILSTPMTMSNPNQVTKTTNGENRLQMNRLRLRKNRLKFKSSGKLPIILEDLWNIDRIRWRKLLKRPHYVSVWTRKHEGFDRLCQKMCVFFKLGGCVELTLCPHDAIMPSHIIASRQ